MGWTVWGEQYESDADGTNLSIYQPVTFNKNIYLKACRTWFIVYNTPVYTSVEMRVYSNSASTTPRALIYTSTNVVTSSQMCTLANGIKEVYFEFDDAIFNSTDVYHFVPYINGYSGNSTSKHLAWKHSYPDPAYQTGLTIDWNFLLESPYDLTFVGAEI